jgi:hypothetical protein
MSKEIIPIFFKRVRDVRRRLLGCAHPSYRPGPDEDQRGLAQRLHGHIYVLAHRNGRRTFTVHSTADRPIRPRDDIRFRSDDPAEADRIARVLNGLSSPPILQASAERRDR